MRDKVLPLFPKMGKGAAFQLQVVGVLSAMLFALGCGYEVLFVNGIHAPQYVLVALLQIVLAAWAIIELDTAAKAGPALLLGGLQFLLWTQLVIVLARHIRAFFIDLSGLEGKAGLGNIPIEASLAFAPAYFFVFLAINRSLINCFSYAEQLRANQLEQARQELSRKLKTSLVASSVAHEINQPLSSILLNVHLTRQELDGVYPPSVTGLQLRLGQMADDSNRVVSTIEIMRNLLRNVQTEHSIFDLSTVVKTALLYQKISFASNNVVLSTTGLHLAHQLLGDGGQLQMAVSNLLRNAVEAINQADIINPRLEVALSRTRNAISLRVADNGPGFPENIRKNTPLITTKSQGSGLGLYLVHLAVENNGGSIRLGRSELLGGAEVTLEFPAVSAP
jgi:hypothetical protein